MLRPSPRSFPALRDSDRDIFEYWDGTRTRRMDPMKADLAYLEDEEFRPDVHPKLANEGDVDAQRVIIRATCRVFGVVEYDGSKGLTIAELLALYSTFGDYLEQLEKKTEHLATSPPPTESTSSTSSEPTTPATSDSGSIDTAPSSESPTESEEQSTTA